MTNSANVQQEVHQTAAVEPAPTVESTGPNQIFDNLTRALTDSELTSPAVAKLILDRMHIAEKRRDYYEGFVSLYHERNLKVAELLGKVKTNQMVEVFFGTGLALGGLIGGFAPYCWDKNLPTLGLSCIVIAGALLITAVLARMYGARS
jgi:hypothetical protein